MILAIADSMLQREVIDSYRAPSNMNVRYVDVSSRFNGHRFCEEFETIFDDFNNGPVWIWNIRAHSPNAFRTMEDGSRIWALDPSNVVDFKENIVGSYNINCPENTNAGWICRTFHPTSQGHQAMKNSIIEALQRDRIPGVNLDYRDSQNILFDT
jgi:hypothetical protein